jgi:hypothetical protein
VLGSAGAGAHVVAAAGGASGDVTGGGLGPLGADRAAPLEPPGGQVRLRPFPPSGERFDVGGPAVVVGWPLDDGQVPPAGMGVVVGVLSGRVLPAVVDQVEGLGDRSAWPWPTS